VAGRGLPEDATVRLANAAERSTRGTSPRGDRRRVRTRPDPYQHALEDVLKTLDHSGARGIRERLEVVADTLARMVDGCSWWISRTDDSRELLCTVNFSAIRFGRGGIADPEVMGGGVTTFPLAQANEAVAQLRKGAIKGAAVLVP